MKFFPEFGLCLGGAIASPATAATGVMQHAEEEGGDIHSHSRATSKRPAKLSGGAAAHWKPKLTAISENSPMSDASSGGGSRRTSGINDKKRPVKAKPKSPAKAAPSSSLANDYWQFSQAMAVPAFSPTSYLF